MKTKTKRIYLLIFALVAMAIGAKAEDVPYAELIYANEQYTLYFKYGELPESTSNDWIYDLSVKNESGFAYWHGFSNFINKVVFDASFSSAQVESTDWWFSGCTNLTSIGGMEYFDASKVSYARYMFYNCTNLTRVDMSFFKPRAPREFQEMFSGCNSLKSVDLSGVDFTQITTCYNMFSGCWKLETVELGGSGYTNSSSLRDCRSMFEDCQLLTTIYCPYALQLKSTGNTTSAYMFKNCLNLQGAVKYQLGNDDISYANPETGYFTIKPVPLGIKLIGQDVTNINCSDLTAIPGVTGTVTYDNATKTLSLTDATITGTDYGIQSESTLDTLYVNVEGECRIDCANGTGIYSLAKCVKIQGGGTLNISGKNGIYMAKTSAATTANYTLWVTDGVKVTVDGTQYGVQGSIRRSIASSGTTYYTKLIVDGKKTQLSVKGGTKCYETLKNFTLSEGYAVTAPTRTAFYQTDPNGTDRYTFCRLNIVIDSGGKLGTEPTYTYTPVSNAWVTIEDTTTIVEPVVHKKGDANGDGSVTMADANLVVNYFLATDKSTLDINIDAANVNGDDDITMADANMIVNMFLNGGEESVPVADVELITLVPSDGYVAADELQSYLTPLMVLDALGDIRVEDSEGAAGVFKLVYDNSRNMILQIKLYDDGHAYVVNVEGLTASGSIVHVLTDEERTALKNSGNENLTGIDVMKLKSVSLLFLDVK